MDYFYCRVYGFDLVPAPPVIWIDDFRKTTGRVLIEKGASAR